jgi:hypothetical protein
VDRLTVELGPEISYLMDATTNHNFGNSFSGSPPFTELLLTSYKNLDLALNVGVGYLLSDKWALNLRYNMGLYDISNDFLLTVFNREEPVLISGPTYNRSLQLSVGRRLF